MENHLNIGIHIPHAALTEFFLQQGAVQFVVVDFQSDRVFTAGKPFAPAITRRVPLFPAA